MNSPSLQYRAGLFGMFVLGLACNVNEYGLISGISFNTRLITMRSQPNYFEVVLLKELLLLICCCGFVAVHIGFS